ncbi:MAG: cyclic nucleotide-binding protein [Paludibacterium sp.]|uniref:CBU_0592 family membrane protein n=1 Tax=Paludibacterium sp. TaxID=1917523 RepID=UPI0025ED4532|nr:cyclic nucleotide-binding protein [Paludibacterium sp.]MBV8045711.1 cyclic nucleotide-binding protein [Paludibacterium sp.]MBV8647763.1 cyclic nucleotide-binding protein [Paludibacterium sp.]
MTDRDHPVDRYDLIGLVGVTAYLAAYFGVQLMGWRTNSAGYLALNVFGPLCILVSLAHSFNLAAFVTQCAWLAITLFGGWRAWRKNGA